MGSLLCNFLGWNSDLTRALPSVSGFVTIIGPGASITLASGYSNASLAPYVYGLITVPALGPEGVTLTQKSSAAEPVYLKRLEVELYNANLITPASRGCLGDDDGGTLLWNCMHFAQLNHQLIIHYGCTVYY